VSFDDFYLDEESSNEFSIEVKIKRIKIRRRKGSRKDEWIMEKVPFQSFGVLRLFSTFFE
jgi:hypothetical protein